MIPAVNHGVPDTGFNFGQSDVFYCRSCRSQVRVAWSEFQKHEDPVLLVSCPTCGFQDRYVMSFVDPQVDDPRSFWGETRLFGAAGTQLIGGVDIVLCPKCLTRTDIQWWEFPGGAREFVCKGCQEKYKLIMSERGRAFRGFKVTHQ